MCKADGEELHCRAATTFCKCHILRPPDFPQPFFPLPPPSFLSFFIVYFWIGNELQNEQRSPWCNNKPNWTCFLFRAFRGKNAWNENFLRASGICAQWTHSGLEVKTDLKKFSKHDLNNFNFSTYSNNSFLKKCKKSFYTVWY